jgi:cobalt/nickel transport system permease protein
VSDSITEATLRGFARALSKALVAEHAARQPGLLQRLDPRVRVVGLLVLGVAVVVCHRIEVIGGMLALAALLAIASRVSLGSLVLRVWLVVLGFTGLIALPALFVTPGYPLFAVPGLRLSVCGLRRRPR